MVERKLVISRLEQMVVTGLFENAQVVELHCDHPDGQEVELGNIYVGKVKNIVPNIGAAFIEIRSKVECYYSLESNPSPLFTNKIGNKPLCIGDELVVQISKEASKTKGMMVTSNINFAGKYVILTKGNNHIGVSGKLPEKKRVRLREIMKRYASEEYGFIVRTNAASTSEQEICNEAERLIAEYERIADIASSRICYTCLKRALPPYISHVRNIYQRGSIEIIVEDEEIYQSIRQYLVEEQPEDLDKLIHYQDTQLPLHKLYRIESFLQAALNEKVWLNSGGYLVIQPTEALTVIDVNSGKCVKKKSDEKSVLKLNLEAAKEAARQIRLRNISGIILIDFVNMEDEQDLNMLVDEFETMLKQDPIPTVFVDITKLQLVEVTRKKVRKPLGESVNGIYSSKEYCN